MRRKALILTLIGLTVLACSCKTKEVPGRRRAPRNCNTCTKWSYLPQEALQHELLQNNEG